MDGKVLTGTNLGFSRKHRVAQYPHYLHYSSGRIADENGVALLLLSGLLMLFTCKTIHTNTLSTLLLFTAMRPPAPSWAISQITPSRSIITSPIRVRPCRVRSPRSTIPSLPQAARLALGLEQGQDVALAHRSLHVADDLTVLLSDELDLHLRTLALGAGAAQHFHHTGENGRLIHFAGILGGFSGRELFAKEFTCIPTDTLPGRRKMEVRWRRAQNGAACGTLTAANLGELGRGVVDCSWCDYGCIDGST